MKILLLLFTLNVSLVFEAFGKSMVYIPEEWRSDETIHWFEIVYMWYDKNQDYVILIENGDQNLQAFKSSGEKYKFFEIRGIDPKTITMKQINDDGNIYIGRFKENYDCSKFNFYKVIYKNGKYMHEPKVNSCFGYKDYSYRDLENIGITLNIIDSYDVKTI